ncbi:sodium-translocating pyrophosphatase [bacterium]|nr:sodium-translocating pyrophosphatase [bacterium]
MAQGEAVSLPTMSGEHLAILYVVLASAIIALLYGAYLRAKVLREDPGVKEMTDVASAIQEGARAYLSRQFKALIIFIIVITVGLFFVYRPVYPDNIFIPIGISLAFLLGSLASFSAGYVGMTLAVQGNVRVANAALQSFKKALELAFQAGTVSGMFTVGLGLLGATLIFLLFKENAMKVLVGFGFGGCLVALFMRVGGGIYTKAADVGADLVGKVEAGIPEDDPRNAAVIADNVGDNVGDCAGMAADVFESYEVTLVAAIILAVGCLADPAFRTAYSAIGPSLFALKLVLYALMVRALGVFSSIIGTWSVRGSDRTIGDPMRPISMGYWISALVSVVGFFLLSYFYLNDIRFGIASTIGILLALASMALTNYFTHPDKNPTTETAYSTRTGAATMLLTGMASGIESSVWAILSICATIILSMIIFPESVALGAYGISLAGLGLLTTTGFILAMDTYGPITDNAHGIFEMSGVRPPEGSQADRFIAWLDAIGNTTKALTKGLAIATAVIAAISLFRSFTEEANLLQTGIQVNLPSVFVGLLIGGAIPFLFSSFAIKAVGRAAFKVVEEVRRQFRTIPGLMEGKARPEYGRCVDIVTAEAQKELIGPAILAIATPIFVGFSLGAGGLGGYLAGAILTGQLLAVYMANTGAIWDNAKKKIEDGYLGGKGTEFHKAAVIGDTVGDPLKDTAGPAINPLIKVMNLVGILIAPIVIKEIPPAVKAIVAILAVIALAVAVWMSKRGSLAEEAKAAEKDQK